MLNDHDKEFIINCGKRYQVSSIYLFGSSLEDDKDSNDIDLGVKGIKPDKFFKFYGELMRNLSKPIDIVDLSINSSFNRIIEAKAIKIYG